MHLPDYTRTIYTRLIAAIAEDYRTYTVSGFFNASKEKKLRSHDVLMRHDVDANPQNALKMGEIDADHGVRSTFYFRMKPGIFHPSIIRKLLRMGHEIGYHYEVLSDAGGNVEKARNLFEHQLARLRSIAPVSTACMHGRGLSRYHNLDFWRSYRLADFQLLVEPYLSIDYRNMHYFSDTGLRWDNERFNLRDTVVSRGNMGVKSTHELIALFKSRSIGQAAILSHTNNWVDHPVLWGYYQSGFAIINSYKRIKKNWFSERIPTGDVR